MNDIEKIVLQMIGENPDSPDVFSDTSTGMAQIRDSINDAIEEIAIITGSFKRTFFLPLREKRAFYRLDDLTDAVAWITDAWLTTDRRRLEQTDLQKLKVFNPRFLLDSGLPRSYFPIGLNWFGVWPVPSSDTDILEITAVCVPGRYTLGTDRLKLRKGLEWAAANYAIGEYFASRGDARQAIEYHTLYMKELQIDLPYIQGAFYHTLKADKEPWPKSGVP